MAENTVEAIFIPLEGIPFLGNVPASAENLIQIKIRNQLTDYVYFGDCRNRLIYHEIDYEEKIIELH